MVGGFGLVWLCWWCIGCPGLGLDHWDVHVARSSRSGDLWGTTIFLGALFSVEIWSIPSMDAAENIQPHDRE